MNDRHLWRTLCEEPLQDEDCVLLTQVLESQSGERIAIRIIRLIDHETSGSAVRPETRIEGLSAR